jgi:hypothetical protein
MPPRIILTAVGSVRFQRFYYLCFSCHQGQSPRDVDLDVENTDYSPGVRRMMALVGSSSSFARGREQLDALAGLKVTTKAVERQAEAIGGDIAACERAEQEQALQLEVSTVRGPQIPVITRWCLARSKNRAGMTLQGAPRLEKRPPESLRNRGNSHNARYQAHPRLLGRWLRKRC